MKAKTSLTLSDDLLKELDRMAGPKVSRSSFVERILREFVERRLDKSAWLRKWLPSMSMLTSSILK